MNHNQDPFAQVPGLPQPPQEFTPAGGRPEGTEAEYAPRLLPGERLINVYRPEIADPAVLPTPEEALLRLTNAPSLDQVGYFGPSVGSRATRANNEVDELRRYEVLFGRDSLTVADFLADQYPELRRTTVIALSKYLGTAYNPKSEQEPGRVPHEVRDPSDPIARQISEERGWEWPQYASVDATPAFISTVAKIVKQSKGAFFSEPYADVKDEPHTMRYAFDQTVSWLERRLGSNPEGLLESKATGTNVINQVWKDSLDSYMHADGTLANPDGGVASIEAQALAYDALLDAAEAYRLTGTPADGEHAVKLEAAAARLKSQVLEQFWVKDDRGEYFAIGTDRDEQGNLRPLKVRSSNMGHVLDSRLLDGDEPEMVHCKEALIKTLFAPDMLNAGGIRTLSKGEYRFRPGSYHDGSVWLWDTYKIARGLSRQGYDALAADLEQRILTAVRETRRYPEFVRGDDGPTVTLNEYMVEAWDEKRQLVNVLEQPPQEIQAWTVAAVLAIKHKRLLADGQDIPLHSVKAQPFEYIILNDARKPAPNRALGALALQSN